jgi:hypothetical protein
MEILKYINIIFNSSIYIHENMNEIHANTSKTNRNRQSDLHHDTIKVHASCIESERKRD